MFVWEGDEIAEISPRYRRDIAEVGEGAPSPRAPRHLLQLRDDKIAEISPRYIAEVCESAPSPHAPRHLLQLRDDKIAALLRHAFAT